MVINPDRWCEGWPEPFSEFKADQWWVKELTDVANSQWATDDQKRAVFVVYHMLNAAEKYFSEPKRKPPEPAPPEGWDDLVPCRMPAPFIGEYRGEVFVAFDPTTDGSHIIGAARSQQEAEEMRDKYVTYVTEGPTVQQLRAEQAAAVMPFIGPLLDAWNNIPCDFWDELHAEAPDLNDAIYKIRSGMEHGKVQTEEKKHWASDLPPGDVFGICGSS